MTSAATAWAWAQRTGNAGAKAVLVAFACYGAAGLCRMPVRELARLTDQGEDAVRVALDALEARGLIRREYVDGLPGGGGLAVRLLMPGAAT